jgi:hypothetical protein
VASGLGASGAGSVNADGTPNTGGESWLGLGLGLLGVGLVARRLRTRAA